MISVGSQILAVALEWYVLGIVAFSSMICLVIYLTRRWHMAFSNRRRDTGAVQAAHSVPTPRIGGLALAGVVLLAPLFLTDWLSARFWLFLISVAPVFFAGLSEDLGWHVRPRDRLLAAAFSSVLAVALLQIWLPRVDVPGVDMLMSWAPFAIVFTIFACTGMSNAFNLIDGVNGLAAMVAIVCSVALAVIAAQVGYGSMVTLLLLLAAGIVGFLLFNFPFGKIFLGDAGAYTLGYVLAWCAVSILFRHPDVSAWAVALIFFWPIADTFLAIYRRRTAGRPTDQPDRLHFHQLVMRGLEITLLGRNARRIANPMTTVVLLPMFTAPAIAGVVFWNDALKAAIAFGVFSVVFVVTYRFGLFATRRKRRRVPHYVARSFHGISAE